MGGKISRDSLSPRGQAVQGGQDKLLHRANMRGSRNFFVRGRGGGSRLLNFFYSLQRGSNGFITHFPGGGVQLFPGGPNANFYRITITCVFPGGGGGGVWTPYPPLDPKMYSVAFLARIGSDEPVRPPFKLRNSKC